MSITYLTGRIYPSRRFSLGFCPKKKFTAEDRRYEHQRANQPEPDYGAVADWLCGVNSIEGEMCFTRDLGLFTNGSKSSQKIRGTYGKHGITKFGRTVVENSCILLEQKYGKHRLGFATCTIPNFCPELHVRLCGYWGEVVRRFYQKVGRHFKKKGARFIYVGVTEIQEKRFKRYGVGCPHLHFVYVYRNSPSDGCFMEFDDLRTIWNAALYETIEYANDSPLLPDELPLANVGMAGIKSSAAAYLGKYMSKGTKVVKAMQGKGYEKFPRQWWTACMQCKKMFKDSIIHMDANMCASFFYQLAAYLEEGWIEDAVYVEVIIGGVERIMGMAGKLSKEGYAMIS